MSLVIKPKETCPHKNICKYAKNGSGVGDCYGANPNREVEFTCNLIEESTPYTPETSIRGRNLLHG